MLGRSGRSGTTSRTSSRCPPRAPRPRNAWRRSRPRIWCGETNRPRASSTPRRSASPSCATARSCPSARTRSRRRRQVRSDRLGVDAAEEGIAFGPERSRAERPAAGEVRHERARRAVHGVGEHGETRGADRARGRRAPPGGRGTRSRRSTSSTVPGRAARRQRAVGLRGDGRVVAGRRASAEVRLDLEAVVLAGVVAGGDRDAPAQPQPSHVVRDGGRRNGAVGEENVDAGAGEDLGRGARELGRQEPRVVPDDDAAPVARSVARDVEARHGRGDPADLGERAVVGDDAAPAVRAEGDRHRAAASAERDRRRASPRRSPRARETPRRGRIGSRGTSGRRTGLRCARPRVPPGRCRGAGGRSRRSRRAATRRASSRSAGWYARERGIADPVEAVETGPSSRPADVPVAGLGGPAADLRVVLAEGRAPDRRHRAAGRLAIQARRPGELSDEEGAVDAGPRRLTSVGAVRRQMRVRVGVVADLVAVRGDAPREVRGIGG